MIHRDQELSIDVIRHRIGDPWGQAFAVEDAEEADESQQGVRLQDLFYGICIAGIVVPCDRTV